MTKAKALEMLESLTETAARLGVEVRTERLQGAGGVRVASGLARVEDQWVVFLEKRRPPQQRLEVLVEALSQFDLSQINLPREARPLFGGPAAGGS